MLYMRRPVVRRTEEMVLRMRDDKQEARTKRAYKVTVIEESAALSPTITSHLPIDAELMFNLVRVRRQLAIS